MNFEQFIQHPTVFNVMSGYLANIPDKNFVFVGQTRNFESDLAHFGRVFNCVPLDRAIKNSARGSKYIPTPRESDLLRELHAPDFEQHERMLRIATTINQRPTPVFTAPPNRHQESIWEEVEVAHGDTGIKLPRFLRNAWLLRSEDYRAKRRDKLLSRADFRLWYLCHGITEFPPHSAAFADIVARFTDLESERETIEPDPDGWFGRLKKYPQAHLVYYLRGDARKNFEIGDERGVEAFLRWWDFQAGLEDKFDDTRQGLDLIAPFNREIVELKDDGLVVLVPRLFRDIWLKRPDLQRGFPLNSPRFLRDFMGWYLEHGLKEVGTHAPLAPEFLEE